MKAGLRHDPMHRFKRGVNTFVFRFVRGVADADQLSIRVEESTAAPAIHRGPGRFQIGRPRVAIAPSDPRAFDPWLTAIVAADAKNFRLRLGRIPAGRQCDRSNRNVGADRNQANIAEQVEGDEASIKRRAGARGEQIHLDLPARARLSENVATGQDQRMSVLNIDHRARRDRCSSFVGDAEPSGRGERGPFGHFAGQASGRSIQGRRSGRGKSCRSTSCRSGSCRRGASQRRWRHGRRPRSRNRLARWRR